MSQQHKSLWPGNPIAKPDPPTVDNDGWVYLHFTTSAAASRFLKQVDGSFAAKVGQSIKARSNRIKNEPKLLSGQEIPEADRIALDNKLN